MATIRYQCPHCFTEDIALAVRAWTEVIENNVRNEGRAVAHLYCPRCLMPSGALLLQHGGNLPFGALSNFNSDPTTGNYPFDVGSTTGSVSATGRRKAGAL